MVLVGALTQLAEATWMVGAVGHIERVYRALAPYAGQAAVCAGAVFCAGSTDFYLGKLAALRGDPTAAGRHYWAALDLHRSLGARPMLARTLHELNEAAEARAIAEECGMTRLLAVLGAGHRRTGRRAARCPGPEHVPAPPRRPRRRTDRGGALERHRTRRPATRRTGLPHPRADCGHGPDRATPATRLRHRTRPPERHPGDPHGDRSHPRPGPVNRCSRRRHDPDRRALFIPR